MYKHVSELLSVDPSTGERITPDEFHARGLSGPIESKINMDWEAREPAMPTNRPALHIIKDIEPYRTVAGDKRKGGERVVITSRAAHREFMKDNNYVEVGNERVTPQREQLSRDGRISDIRRAMRD